MSDENTGNQGAGNEDSVADAVSAVVLVLIPVVTIIYWLSGLPTS